MRYLIMMASASIFLFSNPVYCEAGNQNDSGKVYEQVQGLEWMEMSAGARMDHLMAAMYLLNKNGVELSYAPDYYYDALYQKIQRDPSLYTSSIADILAGCIYEKESKSRPALEQLRDKTTAKR